MSTECRNVSRCATAHSSGRLSLVLITPTPTPGTPFMVEWGHRQLGVEGGDVATVASASLCQHPGAQAEVSLHPT